jgi:hypothetical protein
MKMNYHAWSTEGLKNLRAKIAALPPRQLPHNQAILDQDINAELQKRRDAGLIQ